jgi:L-malate glycosyltransferase
VTTTADEPFWLDLLVGEVEAEAARRRAAPGYPHELEAEIEAELARQAPTPTGRLSLDRLVTSVEEAAFINIDAPSAASRKEYAYLKTALKRGLAWYMRHVANQVSTLGFATARTLRAVTAHIEDVEERLAELEHAGGHDDVKRLPRPQDPTPAGYLAEWLDPNGRFQGRAGDRRRGAVVVAATSSPRGSGPRRRPPVGGRDVAGGSASRRLRRHRRLRRRRSQLRRVGAAGGRSRPSMTASRAEGRRVLQVVPTFSNHDAIGDHARQVDRLLREAGYDASIYADVVQPGLVDGWRPLSELIGGAETDDIVLLHHSTGTPAADRLLDRPEPLVIDYHNITPAELWADWEPTVAAELWWGRRQLRSLAGRAHFALADSPFNADELIGMGYPRVEVAPIVRDFGAVDRRLRPPRTTSEPEFVFVGRVSPNKCQHDLIAALALYRALYQPRARLRLIGAVSSPPYLEALGRLAHELGVGDAVTIDDQGVPEPQLVAAYERATAFVCLSRHEGFCVPLVEAMRHGLPIVAMQGSAVTGTVADGGMLLRSHDPLQVATAWHRVATDAGTWAGLSAAGLAHAAAFDLEIAAKAFLLAFETAVDGL